MNGRLKGAKVAKKMQPLDTNDAQIANYNTLAYVQEMHGPHS
jgi:hypothetical protein